MRLGSQTGNLFNHLMTRGSKPEMPSVGDGATVCLWTDRHAATVIAVEKNIVTVQRDIAVRTDSNGMSDCQDYEYKPDPKGNKQYFRLNMKTGRWVEVVRNSETGRWNINGNGISFGHRSEYHDYSF